MLPLPAAPYEACETRGARVSSLSLVRYHGNDYSVPVAYGRREVLARGHVEAMVIGCGAEVIARLDLELHPHLPRARAAAAGRKAKGRPGRKGTPAAAPIAEYRNPETGETWSGRGRVPRWLKQAGQRGRGREEFAAKG